MTKFLAFLPVSFCLIAAAILAIINGPGWGWFLFVALLLAPTISEACECKCQKECEENA
jgi:predicted membrane protein